MLTVIVIPINDLDYLNWFQTL
uniref:Uncharacterized protein n=1 Tax=Anguilla anguilla TaxID=7936 RepID=A0A0E9V9E7_ANGAN